MKTILPGAATISHATAKCKEDAFRAALDSMPDAEASEIVIAAEAICARVSRKSKSVTISFGELACLELLAALGIFLNDNLDNPKSKEDV